MPAQLLVADYDSKSWTPTDGSSRRYATVMLISLILLHLLASGGGGAGHTSAEARPRFTNRRTSSTASSSWSIKKPRDGGSTEDAAQNGLREKRCMNERAYEACFMCGKIVDNRDIYFGCCAGEPAVLDFCEQLLY